MEALLRSSRVPIGIVTDGRWWALVCARDGDDGASGIVDALTWIEEPRPATPSSTLIAPQHLIGGDPEERLPELFGESVAAAEEITEALGAQVRRAVELLVQAFSEAAAGRARDAASRTRCRPTRRRGLRGGRHGDDAGGVPALRRGARPAAAEPAVRHGLRHQRRARRASTRAGPEEGEEALDATYLTWHRLLATCQALYRGASFEDMRMPAYGGSLFDPTGSRS